MERSAHWTSSISQTTGWSAASLQSDGQQPLEQSRLTRAAELRLIAVHRLSATVAEELEGQEVDERPWPLRHQLCCLSPGRPRSRCRRDAVTGAKGIASPSAGRHPPTSWWASDGSQELSSQGRLADPELTREHGDLAASVTGVEHDFAQTEHLFVSTRGSLPSCRPPPRASETTPRPGTPALASTIPSACPESEQISTAASEI